MNTTVSGPGEENQSVLNSLTDGEVGVQATGPAAFHHAGRDRSWGQKKAEHRHAMLRARDPGRVLLSRAAFGHSTIGAEGLNCRVRDGNGCYTLAVATGKFAVPAGLPDRLNFRIN